MTAVMEDIDLEALWGLEATEHHGKPCEGSKHKPPGCGREAIVIAVWDVRCDHVTPESYHCADHRDEIMAFVTTRDVVCLKCNAPVRLLRMEPIR